MVPFRKQSHLFTVTCVFFFLVCWFLGKNTKVLEECKSHTGVKFLQRMCKQCFVLPCTDELYLIILILYFCISLLFTLWRGWVWFAVQCLACIDPVVSLFAALSLCVSAAVQHLSLSNIANSMSSCYHLFLHSPLVTSPALTATY